jgi:hypothetical protein
LPPTASAKPSRVSDLTSREAVLGWMWKYRAKPDPAAAAAAMRAASQLGAFRDSESAGVYVGFFAGVLASNPKQAAQIVEKTLPLPAEDQWFMVRAIAWSGVPGWQDLLRRSAARLSARKAMLDKHLAGKLPTLDQLVVKDDPAWYEKAWDAMRIDRYFEDEADKPIVLEPSPDLVDALWGHYFATGAYQPVARIISLLPWSKQHDDAEKLTVGSMAKYTLAINAARDPKILELLRWAATQQHPKPALTALKDAIDAAETAETARIRKEALAAIEELKRKGSGTKRKMTWWAQVAEGTIALGCIGAAVAGQVQFGIPCVVGGALGSAGLKYWSAQD